VTSCVSIVSQSGSYVSNGLSDNSLWHLRLGHMSEKGLDILSKLGICHNLPFGERATRDSLVHHPRKENARSCHQRLFEENVRKTKRGLRI